MKTFVLAGHETSASMLNWTLYELMMNDSLMAKVSSIWQKRALETTKRTREQKSDFLQGFYSLLGPQVFFLFDLRFSIVQGAIFSGPTHG